MNFESSEPVLLSGAFQLSLVSALLKEGAEASVQEHSASSLCGSAGRVTGLFQWS